MNSYIVYEAPLLYILLKIVVINYVATLPHLQYKKKLNLENVY